MRTFSTSWSHFWWWVHVESILLDIPVIVIWCWYCCLHCWSKFTALGHEHYRPRSFVWRCSSCRRVVSLLRILKLSSTRTLAIISIAVHLVSWWCGNTDVYFSLTVITLVCTWQRDSTPSLVGFGHTSNDRTADPFLAVVIWRRKMGSVLKREQRWQQKTYETSAIATFLSCSRFLHGTKIAQPPNQQHGSSLSSY